MYFLKYEKKPKKLADAFSFPDHSFLLWLLPSLDLFSNTSTDDSTTKFYSVLGEATPF